MDEVGSACPPVAPQLRAVMREHCHWPRTFWFKPLSPFGLLASHDVYQRFTLVSHVIPPRSWPPWGWQSWTHPHGASTTGMVRLRCPKSFIPPGYPGRMSW